MDTIVLDIIVLHFRHGNNVRYVFARKGERRRILYKQSKGNDCSSKSGCAGKYDEQSIYDDVVSKKLIVAASHVVGESWIESTQPLFIV